MKLVLALLALALPAAAQADCVILLHGLGRTAASMLVPELALRKAGYDTVALSYPAQSAGIDALAADAVERSLARCNSENPVHFVTHSMGGIILRSYLQDGEISGLGRVVMLAPPNHGSELVDRLDTLEAFEWLNGPAGPQMSTDPDSYVNQLEPVEAEIGIVAGNQSYNPISSDMLPGEDDGTVSVASTRLVEMSDHIILPVTHSFLMNNPEVIEQMLHFLASGEFAR